VLARGRSRSRPLPAILEEAERLRDAGYRERNPVLVERKSSQGELYQGHTAHCLKVYFQASPESVGKTERVKLAGMTGDGLRGKAEETRLG
jgi:tRNA A37 methylthiotransferase MiaB